MTQSATIQEMLASARAKMLADPSSARTECDTAIQEALEIDDQALEGEGRYLLSQVFFHLGHNLEAIAEIKRSIEIRENTGDAARASSALNSLGIYLTQIADYPNALETCFRSLKIKEELNDKKGIAATLINIGSIYQLLNNTTQEMKMYERSLQIANEIADSRLIAYNNLNLGGMYINTAQYDKAITYLKDIDETFISFGDKRNAIHALNNQGLILFKQELYDKALEKYERCLHFSEETANIPRVITSLTNIAEVYIKLEQHDKAKEFLDEAVKLSEQHELKSSLKDVRLVLAEYYASMNDHKLALAQYKEHIQLKEELLNIQNLKQLGELHLKYDLDKKEKEALINHLKNVELHEALEKLQHEKNRSDNLLLNILPEEVAEELKATGTAKAKLFDMVTVMFIDIKNFTIISQQLSPEKLVAEIDYLFRGFDDVINRFGLEKIKTIGDAYMCAGGLPVADPDNAQKVANAAFEILNFMQRIKAKRTIEQKPFFEIRIGMNSGPVVAGIVGSSKFAYDIWGDTVNTAARMEQSGEVGKINVSGDTWLLLKDSFNSTYRGKISAKNKGEVDMYFLTPNTGANE